MSLPPLTCLIPFDKAEPKRQTSFQYTFQRCFLIKKGLASHENEHYSLLCWLGSSETISLGFSFFISKRRICLTGVRWSAGRHSESYLGLGCRGQTEDGPHTQRDSSNFLKNSDTIILDLNIYLFVLILTTLVFLLLFLSPLNELFNNILQNEYLIRIPFLFQ